MNFKFVLAKEVLRIINFVKLGNFWKNIFILIIILVIDNRKFGIENMLIDQII